MRRLVLLCACAAVALAGEARADAGGLDRVKIDFDSLDEIDRDALRDDEPRGMNFYDGETQTGQFFNDALELTAEWVNSRLRSENAPWGASATNPGGFSIRPNITPDPYVATFGLQSDFSVRSQLRYDTPSWGPSPGSKPSFTPTSGPDEPVLSGTSTFIYPDRLGRFGELRVTVGATYQAFSTEPSLGDDVKWVFDEGPPSGRVGRLGGPTLVYPPIRIEFSDSGCPPLGSAGWGSSGGVWAEQPGGDGVCTGQIEWRELPVDAEIFADGFESGDVSSWSDWQATR